MKPKTSTKRKPSAAKREPDWLAWEDALLHHCRNITTLAELLFHTGSNDGVTMEVVNDTGGMIKAEAMRLKNRMYARPGRGAK
jgi:hypothetical protein